ncbi:MAG: adhesin [Methanobrevibacter sp.]|uniref:adhesin n=1 Tax=Methanobrevibacter sp. TaxID=66852 RepID=UPI001D787C45|nr:adhesin [Methanobrevibacter sp.]MBE6489750.1 adhesin [Methanobrevibacter sp.]MEE0901882.1 adhesin [Methanobrevibacter sp.]MEE0934306.1 adhesin [Methanobrevibacter sp.]
MKKQIAILLLAILIVAPLVQDVTASKTVFITSDNIIDHDNDIKMLNSIKSYIEEISGGELQVIVDNQAPAPGEGYRAIQVTSDISICLAACDGGNYLQLVQSTSNSSKQIILVNTGDYDLDNHSNYLRRAWDDNYSNETFMGMHDPGTFIKNAGIYYIQPIKEFPDNGKNGYIDRYDEEMNKKIAQEVVDIVNGHANDTKIVSDNLLVTNKISPAAMANASRELVNSNDTEMNGTYGNYTAAQLLYQTSSYLNGNGLDIPQSYKGPENPMGISFLVKDKYSIYDYMAMAGIVRNYMDENGQAPDSIEYNGAHIGYYDLLYNFAKITQNHTDAKHMGFNQEYEFEKVNDSILLHIFPFVLILFVLFLAYLAYKRFRRY